MIHKFFKGVSKVYIIPCFTLIFMWTLLNCLFVELSAELITGFVNCSSDIGVLTIKYVVVIAIWIIIEYIHDVVSDALYVETQCVTDRDGFRDIYNTKPEVLKKVNSGYVTGLIRALDIKRADLMLYTGIYLIMSVVYVGYFAIRLLYFHWIFTLILLISVVGGTAVRTIGRRLVRTVTSGLVEAEGVSTKTFIDISTNINTVQKMQADKFMSAKIDKALCEYKKAFIANTAANDIFYMVFKLIVYMFAPACLFVANACDFGFDKVEFYAMLSPLSVQLVHMAKGIGSYFKRLGLYTSAQKKIDAIVNDDNINRSGLINTFNTIDIVAADYTYCHDITKKTIRVKIPYLKVERGDRVCIYGESGQGKTTTLNIISRQLETNNVYVNGRLVTDRISCVFISQDTEIFDMSVRDNLTLGNPDIHDYELELMLEDVGLGDWLRSQPDGLDTLLGERGVFVSTGQRQRLNLIRGLLIQDKELYLLDEPTSNVDEQTEKKMVELIERKLSNKTFVVVSHRKAIASICNVFYKFENGVCGPEETCVNA